MVIANYKGIFINITLEGLLEIEKYYKLAFDSKQYCRSVDRDLIEASIAITLLKHLFVY